MTALDKVIERLSAFRGTLLRDEPMAAHTSWRVGGPADVFLVPADRAEVLATVKLLSEEGVPCFPVGAGTNLLVRDGGIRGVVMDLSSLDHLECLDDGRVRAGCGLAMTDLISTVAEHGLAGLEYLFGIPGTLGGAAIMNAGAFHQQFGDVVEQVTWLDAGGEQTWNREQLSFSYRTGGFAPGQILVEVLMQFGHGDAWELKTTIRERQEYRQRTHDLGFPNAGSVFRNPPGHNAWRLVDDAGLRGARIGNAQVSEKHTNFIVNLGNARATDILALISEVQRVVKEKADVALEPEVRIVGEDN